MWVIWPTEPSGLVAVGRSGPPGTTRLPPSTVGECAAVPLAFIRNSFDWRDSPLQAEESGVLSFPCGEWRSVSRLRNTNCEDSRLKRLAMLAELLVHRAYLTRKDVCHMELLDK